MAVGSSELGPLYPVAGVSMATVSAGIKKAGRRDLVLFGLVEGAQVAGLYTTNAFRAAPVTLAMQHAGLGETRYFLVNTGNANAGTGAAGLRDALACCQKLAEITGTRVEQVLPFSTGVIGQPLPVDKITAAIPLASQTLATDGWLDAAQGIMTTDTRPKAASRQIHYQGHTLTITGIAKGAGMIKPNMATMLGFVFTDALIPQAQLQTMLQRAADKSFNRITVDGDTSTNDCCMLVATGSSGVGLEDQALHDQFVEALESVFLSLAQGLVRDAEGATKLVSVRVQGAASRDEALKVAYAVAESPLVKTALFASDPNWGRILAAVGRAGVEQLDVSQVGIWLGEVCIVANGGVAADYSEEQGAAVMAREEIDILIHLGRGDHQDCVWTCDFSYDYVKINAEYRT
jgi:glutamate N-acetyltransferase / amino-acid N-acetyltransferase